MVSLCPVQPHKRFCYWRLHMEHLGHFVETFLKFETDHAPRALVAHKMDDEMRSKMKKIRVAF